MEANKQVSRNWYLIDAQGQTLGRLASQIAFILQGKHKTTYVPYIDSGDFVIVINAREVQVTGNKKEKKLYYSHSNYPGGLKVKRYKDLLEKSPEKIIFKAVRNMLPDNKLRSKMIKKLKIYANDKHCHQAQKPIKINLTSRYFKEVN